MLKRLLLIFTILLLLLVVIGATYAHLAIKNVEHEAFENLQSICRLKAKQISSWLEEREADAFTLKSSENLALRIEKYIQQNKDTDKQILLSRIDSVRQAYGYDSVLLIDTQGKLLIGAGSNLDIPSVVQGLLKQTIQNQRILHTDLYRENNQHIHLDWVVPVIKSNAEGETVIAAIILRTKPANNLFSVIRDWPVVSASAESLLVRKQGDSALVLNELRHRRETALQFRLPLSIPDLPAATALRTNQAGTMPGRDYRGVEVLSAYQTVNAEGWRIIVKIDRSEVLKPMWDGLKWFFLISFMAVLIVMVSLWRLLLQQSRLNTMALEVKKTRCFSKFNR